MRTTRLIAVLVGLAAIAMVTADASAYYHPGMGCFMSRDPGAGGANRIGAGGPAVGGGFIPRDPTGSNQYADGMNLYQYVRSNPINRIDPSGLFGRETHFDQVKDSMHRRCPAIEDAVAAASQGMDEGFHDAPSIIIIGWLTLGLNTLRPEVQQDYDYHFPGAGPPFPGQQNVVQKGWSNPTVMALYKRVTDKKDRIGCDPAEFGKFLHMLADSYSHGGGTPDGPFFGHPKGVKIFILDDDGPDELPDGTRGRWDTSGGWSDTRVDDPKTNWVAWNEAVDAMRVAMDAFKSACPCACAGKGKDK